MKKSELKSIIQEVIRESYDDDLDMQRKLLGQFVRENGKRHPDEFLNRNSAIDVDEFRELLGSAIMFGYKQRGMLRKIFEDYRGIIGWAEFVTPIQQQKVDELLKKGFKVTHTAFDAGEYGDPGEDKSITVYLTKRSGPSTAAFEVDSEGNVN